MVQTNNRRDARQFVFVNSTGREMVHSGTETTLAEYHGISFRQQTQIILLAMLDLYLEMQD